MHVEITTKNDCYCVTQQKKNGRGWTIKKNKVFFFLKKYIFYIVFHKNVFLT